MINPIDAIRIAIKAWDPTAVSAGEKPTTPTLSYAVWRFLTAWAATHVPGVHSISPDAAVLLRQVIRWHGGELRLPTIPSTARATLGKAGLEVTAIGNLRAAPFCPQWLSHDHINPAEGIDRVPQCSRADTALPAEPYLAEIATGGPRQGRPYTSWQSAAQKEAAWQALSTPGGSTCTVVLPTGTGKSLIFQVLAARCQGLTVVVVPTVALAIDQYRSACEVVPGLSPRYYAAGDDTEGVIDALQQKACRLLITSPEACVSGKLRAILQGYAAQGWLDNLVIDEVHLVETWGAYFRVDFQLLSGVRMEWLLQPGARLRTLLLTATLTPSGREDLKGLFPPAPGGTFSEFLSQRLRPEMVYYDQKYGSRQERDAAVLESIWRLPRPMILYTTEVKDAEAWARRLRDDEQFQRVACFHGDTPSSSRRALLDNWRADRIDLMVATSAFGVGVDKPDVRTVVHACYPEDMNRYYQEVGRSGRDGWTTACLLLPTEKDEKVAAGLGARYLLPDSINERWQALSQPEYCKRLPGADDVWRIDPAAVRTGLLGKRTGKENVLWNKRLLLQLHRAGYLTLRGVSYECGDDGEANREWIEAELRFNPQRKAIGSLVKGPREEELASVNAGLRQISDYLTGGKCVARVLAALYGEGIQRVCAGCRHCRKAGVVRRSCPELEWECSPVATETPTAVLVGGLPHPAADSDAFRSAARGCFERKSIRRFTTNPEYLEVVSQKLAELYSELPLYLRTPYRIDAIGDEFGKLLPGEKMVVFHLGRVANAALSTLGGAQVIHWFRPPVALGDIRYPLAERGIFDFRFYTTPENWFQS